MRYNKFICFYYIASDPIRVLNKVLSIIKTVPYLALYLIFVDIFGFAYFAVCSERFVSDIQVHLLPELLSGEILTFRIYWH